MILTVDQLNFSYGSRAALRDISFALAAGELKAVLGPNGSGKTTLFRCVLGTLKDYTGTVLADGADMRRLSQRERAARIAYIPQIHRPTFGYSVLDTVLMGVARSVSVFAQPDSAHEDIAMDALTRVGAEKLKDRNFAHLSGGEQQLVQIARAIAQRSDILIMDEPTSALDYGNRIHILELVRELADSGYGILLSTHNPQDALTFADGMLALDGGRIAAQGSPRELIDEALIRRLYGVETVFISTDTGQVIAPGRMTGTEGKSV